jgi:dynein heavy chain
VLRQERGNVLLVGVGGSGRRSMARLAAYMNEQKTTSIEIIKGYREKNFHEDIREMLRRAGVDNEKLIFLFSDTQIVVESFLEDINNLINSGEIPRLFAPEDKQSICEEISSRAREAGQGDNRDQQYAYFVQICRDNLHIVLAFSPVGDLFRNRCRQFPSITNCCTIDWYNPWPADALHAVAHREYSAAQDALGISDHLDQLCLLSVEIHKSVSIATDQYLEELRRYNYTTPTSYLDLLKTYRTMLGEKRAIVPREIEKYKNGLQKLADTKLMIDELQKKLVILLPQIDESKAETAKLVENLQVQQKDAQEQEKIVSVEAAEAGKIYDSVMGQKKECEDALETAMPIYHKALGALKTLKKEDIDEVKNYKIVAPEVEKVF